MQDIIKVITLERIDKQRVKMPVHFLHTGNYFYLTVSAHFHVARVIRSLLFDRQLNMEFIINKHKEKA